MRAERVSFGLLSPSSFGDSAIHSGYISLVASEANRAFHWPEWVKYIYNTAYFVSHIERKFTAANWRRFSSALLGRLFPPPLSPHWISSKRIFSSFGLGILLTANENWAASSSNSSLRWWWFDSSNGSTQNWMDYAASEGKPRLVSKWPTPDCHWYYPFPFNLYQYTIYNMSNSITLRSEATTYQFSIMGK